MQRQDKHKMHLVPSLNSLSWHNWVNNWGAECDITLFNLSGIVDQIQHSSHAWSTNRLDDKHKCDKVVFSARPSTIFISPPDGKSRLHLCAGIVELMTPYLGGITFILIYILSLINN